MFDAPPSGRKAERPHPGGMLLLLLLTAPPAVGCGVSSLLFCVPEARRSVGRSVGNRVSQKKEALTIREQGSTPLLAYPGSIV